MSAFRFYGRRQGRPLSEKRAEVMDTILEKYRFPKIDFSLSNLFPPAIKEIWLEIGFGNGAHLAAQALQNPSIGFIGAEVFLNGISALSHIMDQENIQNIRIFPDDARDLLTLLPESSITKSFILFPDPWPKARHHKRRFIQKETLDRLSFILKDRGTLCLASDDPGLSNWMLEKTWSHDAFQWAAKSRKDWEEVPTGWISTRYEQKARQEGRTPKYLLFERNIRRT